MVNVVGNGSVVGISPLGEAVRSAGRVAVKPKTRNKVSQFIVQTAKRAGAGVPPLLALTFAPTAADAQPERISGDLSFVGQATPNAPPKSETGSIGLPAGRGGNKALMDAKQGEAAAKVAAAREAGLLETTGDPKTGTYSEDGSFYVKGGVVISPPNRDGTRPVTVPSQGKQPGPSQGKQPGL